MKRIISGILVVIMLCVFPMNNKVWAEDTPNELKELYARSAVLMDADSGRILFGKNESDVLAMASTTKIMTCILALENMKKDQIAEVSETAVKQPKVHLGVKTGEKYYVKDLLYSLMLESHNDSAVIIAESIDGAVEVFAERMNRKAKEIGCSDTYFITPNGLDAESENGVHSTTAKDLARIMRYCIRESSEKERFIEITRQRQYTFSDVEGKRQFVCNNHNLFLDMMEGALSGKTGFTNDAGYCYVGALKKGERTFIVALLACGWPGNKGYKWKDTKRLMEFALDHYDYKMLSVHSDCGEAYVLNGVEVKNPLKKQNSIKIKMDAANIRVLMNENESIEEKKIINHAIEAPVSKGEKVGKIYYVIKDHILYSADVVADEAVGIKDMGAILKYIFHNYLYNTKSEKESQIIKETVDALLEKL